MEIKENKDTWLNPNASSIGLKITSAKWADDFINKGKIKFGTPNEWVKNSNCAIADNYEGLVAFCHQDDFEKLREYFYTYPPTDGYERIRYKQRVLIKRKRTMELPCFCFYAIYMDSFTIPDACGMQTINSEIPKRYFVSYADNGEENKQIALIFISNLRSFFERVQKALIQFGFEQNEIMLIRPKYRNYDGYGAFGFIEVPGNSPEELYFKSDDYDIQSEARIIINSNNKTLIDLLIQKNKGLLEIGSIKDIASYSVDSYKEEMKIQLTAEIRKLIDK